ncbi:uncharacterized protein LOC126748469 [Anthonomus grandis grandis]|uniref:uncharacterized protein LOC126748469 n=1 Tax=Anthonomus grandis grandis TaxID=2921223 RepID=UPI002164F405|nr:uncharacterized protein LOC126748469 [Anthonomus grandis grandis]
MSEKFSPEDDEVLIDLVRQHPPLYSVAGKSYKDLVVKNNIWKEIGAKMNKKEKVCQIRWKNIRDYYQKKKREVIKAQKTGSARNTNVENFGVKYKHLSFLDNTSIVERKSISNINEESNSQNQQSDNISTESQDVLDESQAAVSDIEDSQEMVDSQVSPVTEVFPNTQESHENQSFISPTTTSQRKRKSIPKERGAAVVEEIKKGRIERTKLMKELLDLSNNKTKEDDTALSTFFRSIALTVEQLPPYFK